MFTEINLSINENSKEKIRKQLCKAFLKEEPGKGTGELASKYRYYVEEIGDQRIYLSRPANLNNGFDFTIHVENEEFNGCRTRNKPTHTAILRDLASKKTENEDMYEKVKILINKIYNCDKVTQAEYDELNFQVGKPIEMILKVLKWLFIEQDITYWNYSGRGKLYSALGDDELC